MNFKKKRFLTLGVTVALLTSLIACSNSDDGDGTTSYTYKSATTALGDDWNPHTWESSSESTVLGYLSEGLFGLTLKDSEAGEYQWSYDLGLSIEDVTNENQSLLTDYSVSLPTNQTAANTTEGFVYDISLRTGVKWQDGSALNADDYIYSYKQLLNPVLQNYRANNTYSGDSAIAGASAYYFQGQTLYDLVANVSSDAPGYTTDDKVYVPLTAANNGYYGSSYALTSTAAKALIAKNNALAELGLETAPATTDDNYATYKTAYDTALAAYEALIKAVTDADTTVEVNAAGFIEKTDNNASALAALIAAYNDVFVVYDDELTSTDFYYKSKFMKETEWSSVGVIKVDDNTIRLVAQTQQDINYFKTSLTSVPLVHEATYEACLTTVAGVTTSTYGTSVATTMSYGPYKLVSLEANKQMVFEQNENWWGYTKNADGTLSSQTTYEIDGKKQEQYKTTKIVIDVMTEDAMKLAFFKGDLMSWTTPSDELTTYAMSDKLYKVDETYTMSLFFNSDEDDLKAMDETTGNVNSVVLSNDNFRKAFSFAIDRADYVKSTEAYKPAFSLLSGLYFYDIYNDPTSRYRDTDQAMTAITNLYGVEYGDGKDYATLQEAHDSIDGYNLADAKTLMKSACEELVADGLYTAGNPITINLAYAKGALTTDENAQVAKFQSYLNAAAEGSGFGTITLTPNGNLSDRYGAVGRGEYAIGYGAWGGAAFYPFQNFRLYGSRLY